MQKELMDEEFLEYIMMTMPQKMFPTGRPERIRISGISLNYAFIGAGKGGWWNRCTKNIEAMAPSEKRLYWKASVESKTVVGLIREDNRNDWLVPAERIISDESVEDVMVTPPEYEKEQCEKWEVQLNEQCSKHGVGNVDYNSMGLFLSSLRGAQRQRLAESNELCVKCLFLFYPSLIREFCNDLMHWCNMMMDEQKYAQLGVILNIFFAYLELLENLKNMTKNELSIREIANVLNNHQLQILSFKIERELQDSNAEKVFRKCLKQRVRSGMLNMYPVEDLKIDIDLGIRGGKELMQSLWDIKQLAASIREI